MKKILIDDNERDEQGNKIVLSIIYYENSDLKYPELLTDEEILKNDGLLVLELQFGNEIRVPGYELVRDKYTLNGVERIGSFYLAPDQAYALFKHWRKIGNLPPA